MRMFLEGTAFDPCVWSPGLLPEKRKVKEGVRDFAFRLGPYDVLAWPYSVGILVKCFALWGSLFWPSEARDRGEEERSYHELLILCERWAGGRLYLEVVWVLGVCPAFIEGFAWRYS